MQFIETIEEFMKTISDSSLETYRAKINIFYQFLTKEKTINNSSYGSYLEAMKIEEIGESLDYYISTNSIKSQTIAWHYISVIKRYFNFLYKLGIQNDKLIKSFGLSFENTESFQNKLREKILNDPRLEKKDEKEELTWQEAEVLIAECDQRIMELTKENKVLEYKVYSSQYNDLMSSIIIKLILFSGITYRVVRDINYNKLKKINNVICINIICINDYFIHLPNNLSEQLAYYDELRNIILENSKSKSDELFIGIDGKKLSKKTSIIANTLREYIDRTDLTGIIKFAVIQMISKGINQSIIQDFTNIGDPIYKYCQEKVNIDKDSSVSRYLDSKLRSLELFDRL